MTPQTSYQTALLHEYREDLRNRATALFQLVEQRLSSPRVREYKGSFSILERHSDVTAAKIVIYEYGKGSLNGPEPDPQLEDGVYVWIRAPGAPAKLTIGVAPHHDQPFAYFRFVDGQNMEEVANFIVACADSPG